MKVKRKRARTTSSFVNNAQICFSARGTFSARRLATRLLTSCLNNMYCKNGVLNYCTSKRLSSISDASEPARRIGHGQRRSAPEIVVERVEDGIELLITPRSCRSGSVVEPGGVERLEGRLRVEWCSRVEVGSGDEVMILLGFELENLGLNPGDGGDGELGVSPRHRVECFENPVDTAGISESSATRTRNKRDSHAQLA